jgi:Phage capsid family
MARNQSLLQKADIVLSNLTSNSGLLNPEQADTFIRKLIRQPTILRECRVVTMSAPIRKINRIGFLGRILRAAPADTSTGFSSGSSALTATQRVLPTTDQVQLTTNEVIAQINLPYDVIEDNIEHATAAMNEVPNTGPGGLRDTIIQLIAEYAARDIEDLALNGNTAYTTAQTNALYAQTGSGTYGTQGGPGLLGATADATDDTAFMQIQNGFLAIGQNSGNTVDIQGDTVTKTVFKKGIYGMPVQYLRNRPAMKHYVSVDNEVEFQDTLANRGTAMGDSRLQGNQPAMAYGSQVIPTALMPDTNGLFCDPLNLIVGFWRQLSMEFDKDITQRVYLIVLTARLGLQVEQADALVTYKNITPPS